jgi:hypothetical protein
VNGLRKHPSSEVRQLVKLVVRWWTSWLLLKPMFYWINKTY